MRQHGNEIPARLGINALIPQIHEIAEALGEYLLFLLLAFNQAALIGNGGRDVRPVTQLAPVLEREVEQGRQHLAGELDRDLIHPVEGFAARQAIERVTHAGPDQALEIGEIVRRDDRLHHLALHVVLGRVHGDEHGQFEFGRPVAQRNAAECRTGREPPMVHFERNDVFVLGDRPIRPDRTVLAIVNRRLAPQPAKIGLPDMLLIQSRIADVDLIERHGLGERRVIVRLGRLHDGRDRHCRSPFVARPPFAGRIKHKANGLTRTKRKRPTKDGPNEGQKCGCHRAAGRMPSAGLHRDRLLVPRLIHGERKADRLHGAKRQDRATHG